jgi:hypothetical protein
MSVQASSMTQAAERAHAELEAQGGDVRWAVLEVSLVEAETPRRA